MDLKLFFVELLDYNRHSNAELIAYIEQNASRISARTLLLTSHVLNAHAIWNARIEGKSQPFQVWEEHRVDRLKTIDEANHINTGRVLEEYPLDQVIAYRSGRGDSHRNNVREVFFHIINHSTYHRGQIATELRVAGLKPLASDYIFYKR